MRTAPVLLTYDIHIHARHPAPDVERYLLHVVEDHRRTGVKASFFFPAEGARLMKGSVRLLLQEGHQIGCHGLTHRNETYDSMPPAVQRETLTRATREIEDVIQQRVTFFRAPVSKISAETIRILEELGYEADLSMSSQRLGVFSSDMWNVSWLFAPRLPYHPDVKRPWRRGASKLWEIPLSCLGLPFMVNTGLIFGATFMKAFFRGLYLESCWNQKPIVYMVHPEDLYPWQAAPWRAPFRWREMLPNRADGLSFKYRLFETDPVKIARDCQELAEYMRSFPRVRFLTVPEYVAELGRRAEASSGHA